jgi:hypothetical protein
MPVWFTKHAEDKFTLLKRHGFKVSKKQVLDTLKEPMLIDTSRLPLSIAQKSIDAHHVLRVVYRVDGELKTVITFYPGRKKNYVNRR